MLENRDYMRGSSYESQRSATVGLVIALGVAFVLQQILYRWGGFPVDDVLALSAGGLKRGWLWQLLSFQFMHASLLHLLGNCFAIYVFGRAVEEALGRKRFLALYLLSGVLGGLVQALAGLLLGGAFASPVVGASAGAFGLVAAFSVLFPDQVLLLFFIIPMRARFLLLLSVLYAVFGILFPMDNLAHPAHLGGMLAGVLMVRHGLRWEWPRLGRRAHPLLGRRPDEPAWKPGRWGRSKPTEAEELPPEEFLSKEVDPILDKITAHGIQSLTARERRILELARDRMAKR